MQDDIKKLISIRSQATEQFSNENVDPEDLLFYWINGDMGMSLIPFEGDFPPSYKYNARKQALKAIISGQASAQLKMAERLVYFSIDPIYNIDYCFDVDNTTDEITLYIIKDSSIIRRYKNYDMNYDERKDLAHL